MCTFSVDCNTVDITDILEIHKCFMKRRSIVEMPGFIMQTFTALVLVLLSFKGSLATKCISMNNQSRMMRPMLSDLNPDDLHYYPFMEVLILLKINLEEHVLLRKFKM